MGGRSTAATAAVAAGGRAQRRLRRTTPSSARPQRCRKLRYKPTPLPRQTSRQWIAYKRRQCGLSKAPSTNHPLGSQQALEKSAQSGRAVLDSLEILRETSDWEFRGKNTSMVCKARIRYDQKKRF